jgi:hypothetical protein
MVYIHLTLKKNNRKRRRCWQTQIFTHRLKFVGNSLLNDLITQEINGQFQNCMRMRQVTLICLLILLGQKSLKLKLF